MKKRLSKFALFFLSLSLTGCNIQFVFDNSNSPTTSSTSEDKITTTSNSAESSSSTSEDYTVTKRLSVTQTPATSIFYLYDILDLSGLVISEDTYRNNTLYQSTPITDYTLTYADDNSTVEVDKRLTNYREVASVIVSKEGCESTDFTFFMDDVSDFSQTLTFTSKTETSFFLPATFSLDGLSMTLETSYKAGKTKRFSELLSPDDYQVTLTKDDQTYDPDNFEFQEAGKYQLNVTCLGWNNNEISASYTINVFESDDFAEIISPTPWIDTTINFQEDTTKMQVTFTNLGNELEPGDKGYYSPDEVSNAYNIKNYSTNNAANQKYTPSAGNVPFLIVPIVTPGDENKATLTNWNLIRQAFFGNSEDLAFESAHSYYYQSSYGKLNIMGGVTDYFTPSTVDSTFANISNYTGTNIDKLPQLALDWAVETYGIDPAKYDSNNDHYVDAIWMVYLHKTSSNSDFWAYVTTTGASYESGAPIANNYGWASIDFLNDTYISSNPYYFENHNCDAHVIIHESGHLFGLQDYYSYSYNDYAPLGGVDFMDNNVGDHNPYSKMIYGWITPYIVYGNCTITIPSCQSKDAVIVIPYDNKTYQKDSNGLVKFNVYDEYLVLDYYTSNNLNQYDYDCYSAETVKGSGGRLYHVDARLFKYSGGHLSLFDDPDEVFSTMSPVYWGISNSETGERAEENNPYISSSSNVNSAWDEIRWITANKVFLDKTTSPNNASLFAVNSTFSINNFKSQFNETEVEEDENTVKYYTNICKPFTTSFVINSLNA